MSNLKKKFHREKEIIYDLIYMSNLKKKNELKETECRLMVAGVRWGRGMWKWVKVVKGYKL